MNPNRTGFLSSIPESRGKQQNAIDILKSDHRKVETQEKPGSAIYDEKVFVLKQYVNNHVKEEEKELFPKIISSGIDLNSLGAELDQAKLELKQNLQDR